MKTEKRKAIEEKLLQFDGDIDALSTALSEAAPLYMQALSEELSGFIGELSDWNAPFLIAILEKYAEAVSKAVPVSRELVDELKSLEAFEITKKLSGK